MRDVTRRAPAVRFAEPTGPVTAVTLVLPGGKVASHRSPHRRQLAVARMAPFARALERGGGGRGVAVGTVLYRFRGWNGAAASPVQDVRVVLNEVRERFGDVPVVLVGHSMGGRAALRCADDAAVVGVLALAPWLESGDPVTPVTGKDLLILHGDRDRWTDPAASLAFARAARGQARTVGRIEISGDGHTMLRRASLWHELTTAFTLRTLGRQSADGQQAKTGQATNALDEMLTGDGLSTV